MKLLLINFCPPTRSKRKRTNYFVRSGRSLWSAISCQGKWFEASHLHLMESNAKNHSKNFSLKPVPVVSAFASKFNIMNELVSHYARLYLHNHRLQLSLDWKKKQHVERKLPFFFPFFLIAKRYRPHDAREKERERASEKRENTKRSWFSFCVIHGRWLFTCSPIILRVHFPRIIQWHDARAFVTWWILA